MASLGQFVGFVPAADLVGARAFYESVLGLTVVEESPFALVLDCNGTAIRLTAVGVYEPQPFTVAGWTVDDVARVIDALVPRGVTFIRYEGMGQDERGIWASPSSALVAWFADPEGNILSLTQL